MGATGEGFRSPVNQENTGGSKQPPVAPGHLGEPEHLLARSDIVVGTNYASGEEALAHLGFGEATRCDIRVTWAKNRFDQPDFAVDKFIVIPIEP